MSQGPQGDYSPFVRPHPADLVAFDYGLYVTDRERAVYRNGQSPLTVYSVKQRPAVPILSITAIGLGSVWHSANGVVNGSDCEASHDFDLFLKPATPQYVDTYCVVYCGGYVDSNHVDLDSVKNHVEDLAKGDYEVLGYGVLRSFFYVRRPEFVEWFKVAP